MKRIFDIQQILKSVSKCILIDPLKNKITFMNHINLILRYLFLQCSFFGIHAHTMVLIRIEPSSVSLGFGIQYCSKKFPLYFPYIGFD